jgi:hypothetical protein
MLPPLMLILQRPLLGYRASADKQISQICAYVLDGFSACRPPRSGGSPRCY